MEFRLVARIKTGAVKSLVWSGESLIDWAAGGKRFQLDGVVVPRAVNYAYHFDAACASPSGDYVVIYERLGTKGLVLKAGTILREIDRSFYHADVYEYPVCLARRPSGREVLIHCPAHYNRIEFDDLETGERLTACDRRKPCDFFHSRFSVAPNGADFLSAGWIWHPLDALAIFRLESAIAEPTGLDGLGERPPEATEISSAAFLDDERVVVSTSDETFADDSDFASPDVLRPSSIAVWDVAEKRLVSQAPLTEPAGTLMPLDERHAVGFFEHPKIIDVQTGGVVARLNDVNSGNQTSSIIHHLDPLPALALDPPRRRFAVASNDEVLVYTIELSPE